MDQRGGFYSLRSIARLLDQRGGFRPFAPSSSELSHLLWNWRIWIIICPYWIIINLPDIKKDYYYHWFGHGVKPLSPTEWTKWYFMGYHIFHQPQGICMNFNLQINTISDILCDCVVYVIILTHKYSFMWDYHCSPIPTDDLCCTLYKRHTNSHTSSERTLGLVFFIICLRLSGQPALPWQKRVAIAC